MERHRKRERIGKEENGDFQRVAAWEKARFKRRHKESLGEKVLMGKKWDFKLKKELKNAILEKKNKK